MVDAPAHLAYINRGDLFRSDRHPMTDKETLAVYAERAAEYRSKFSPNKNTHLEAFIAKLDPGAHVLDLGCGTGILAIAAVKQGANKVWATDINDWSIQNSKENFELNDCHGIKLLCGQIDELDIPLQFDLVLANINRNVLLEEIPSYLSKMKSEATLLLSGFFEEDEHLIRGKAEECGLVVKQRDVRNNWCVLSCQLS